MSADAPPWATLDVPTLHDQVARHAMARPDAIAVRFGTRTINYRALDSGSRAIAARLTRAGIGIGDRIVFVGRNSDTIPLIALAANRIGAVPVPLNWRLAPAEVAAQIVDAAARVVVVEPDHADMVARLCETFDMPVWIVLACDIASDSWRTKVDVGLAACGDGSAVAVQIYTSGTTGEPKGVMLTHINLNGINLLRPDYVPWDRWNSGDVTLISAPLGHIGAYGMMVRALFFGGEVVIQEAFDAGAVLDAIEHERVSKIALVPTAIKLLLDHPRARNVDYSRIDTIIYGASPITVPLLREAMAVFGCRFAQSYGQTETSGPVVALEPDDHDPRGTARMASAGRALPATDVRIVADDGQVLGPGQDGEICVRSIATMKGYWRRPDETAAVLSSDGWLRTGDAGYIDDDGYVFVRARVKDMIISGAENVYPAEVENVLAAHPDVGEVAVIGVPDAHWGEAVKAIVVARAGVPIDTAALRSWTRDRIAGYKVPKSIDVVPGLPCNATGKVDKRALRKPFWR